MLSIRISSVYQRRYVGYCSRSMQYAIWAAEFSLSTDSIIEGEIPLDRDTSGAIDQEIFGSISRRG
jgi:hypothetical protein